jgi:hypothetical protein
MCREKNISQSLTQQIIIRLVLLLVNVILGLYCEHPLECFNRWVFDCLHGH